MKPFPEELFQHLRDHTLVGIRVGPDRKEFLDIWMVAVAGRIFARSWNRSMSGWFGGLIRGQSGMVRFGEHTLEIVGKRPTSEPGLMQRIDQAYLERFTQPENISYATTISQPEYHSFTIEVLPAND